MPNNDIQQALTAVERLTDTCIQTLAENPFADVAYYESQLRQALITLEQIEVAVSQDQPQGIFIAPEQHQAQQARLNRYANMTTDLERAVVNRLGKSETNRRITYYKGLVLAQLYEKLKQPQKTFGYLLEIAYLWACMGNRVYADDYIQKAFRMKKITDVETTIVQLLRDAPPLFIEVFDYRLYQEEGNLGKKGMAIRRIFNEMIHQRD